METVTRPPPEVRADSDQGEDLRMETYDELRAQRNEARRQRDLASGLQNQLDEAEARLKGAVAQRDEAQRRLEMALAQRDEHDVKAQTLMEVIRLLIAGRA